MPRGLKPFLLACLMTTIWLAPARAAVPNTMSYQGMLTDGVGAPVPDGTYDLTFKLYFVASGPGWQWQETQSGVPVTGGMFSVQLGSVNPLTLAFDRPLFLGVQVGTDPELAPRTPLSSSPYALGVRLQPNTIDATVLIDEPGIAQATRVGSFAIIGNANINPILLYPDFSVVINTPGPGYVMVTASAYVTMSNVTGPQYVEYQLSETTGFGPGDYVPEAAGYTQYCGFGTAPNTNYFDWPLSVHRVFVKPAAGSYRFSFCSARLGSYTPQNTVTNLTLTATFFPTAYGTVSSSQVAAGQSVSAPVRSVPLGADAQPSTVRQP